MEINKIQNNTDFQETINKLNEYVENIQKFQAENSTLLQPAANELGQFTKTWFYNNWKTRFMKIKNYTRLGLTGVISVPNTTFEEWLWWFHEWAESFATDYNDFKELTFQALMVIEKHLEAIDSEVENHEERVNALEGAWKEIGIQVDGFNTKLTEFNTIKIEDRLLRSNKIYKTVSELSSADNLVPGDLVQTQGYYAPNDGGGAFYIVKDSEPAKEHVTMVNNYAELVYDGMHINVRQFGVNPSQADNYDKLQDILNRFIGGGDIYFPNGTYKVSKTLVINGALRLRGEENTILQKTTTTLSGYYSNFNNTGYTYSTNDVLMIVGPQLGTSSNQPIHNIKFDRIKFICNDDHSYTNYGLVLIGTAYLVMDNCQVYGFSRNIEVHDGFGFRFTNSISTQAKYYALSLDHKTIHAYISQSSLENVSPMYSTIRVFNGAKAAVTNTALTMTGVSTDGDGSSLRISNCQFETSSRTISATSGGRVTVTNCDIERHQDSATDETVALLYCVGGTINVSDCMFYWRNYSGQPDQTKFRQYSISNQGTIVVTQSEFNNFPAFENYENNSKLLIINDDYEEFAEKDFKASSSENVTILGQTIKKTQSLVILNVGIKLTGDVDSFKELFVIPTKIKPYSNFALVGHRKSDNAVIPMYTTGYSTVNTYVHLNTGDEINLSGVYVIDSSPINGEV